MCNISGRLRTLRKLAKKTQKEISLYLDISERAYQHYELNDREPPLSKAIALADYFDVSLDYLVGRSDDPKIDLNSSAVDIHCEIAKLNNDSLNELREHIKYLKLKQDGLLEAKIIKNTAATYMKDGKIISKIPDALNLINEDLVEKSKKTELSDKIKFKLSNKKRK